MLDIPALSYGLFHAQVKANKLFRVVTTGITFQGLNMDIGHVRHNRWVLNDDPKAAINSQPELTQSGRTAAHSRWIAYNKLRGQTASALEHAVPEQFWVDKSLCRYADETGAIKNPTQADCAQAVSAVKAIAIAQSQGQRIYTITPENAATALPKLPIGGTVGEEVRAAVQAGKEVTIHESPITAHGWSGYGYAITDPETGAGAYLIEGRGNGAILLITLGLISFAFPPLWFIFAVGVTNFVSSAAIVGLIVAMIGGISGYIETLNKVIDNNHLTDSEKQGVLKFIAAATVLANILAAVSEVDDVWDILRNVAYVTALLVLAGQLMDGAVAMVTWFRSETVRD